MKNNIRYIFSFIFIILMTFNFNNIIVRADNNTFTRGIVKGTDVSVRTGAGSNYSRIKNDTGSYIYLSNPESVEVLGKSGSWYNIRFLYSGFIYTGYISDSYLIVNTVTLDSNYENSLRSKGFPESYIKKLSILHSLHPNWNFEVSNTGLDFNSSVDAQTSPVNKSLINSSNTTLRSTADGAYINGNYIQYGTGWYVASKQTIGYFMDPRNFLDEGHIFMFEQLSYNPSTHNENTVQQILNSSFMKGSYNYNNQTFGFANTFMIAAKTHNVSPIHLATRALQEQGGTGSVLSLGNGYNGSYVGYYNFFNIGATGNNNYDIIMNGLKYAYSRGWNSQYLSIVNGSSLMGNGYIKVGQDTQYYEKFNTINKKALHYNQYMQNVKAPYSEAYSTYKGYYKAGLLDSSYTFKIPIYNNMPDATTLSTSENSDNTLKSLSVSNCTLNPSFISSATNYTCSVSQNVNEVTVNAQKTSSYSSIKGDGVIKLNNNSTNINVEVTAANGNKRVYTVTVNKVVSGKETPADIISSIGYNNNNNIITGIPLGTDVSNIINSIKNKYVSSSIEITNKDGISKPKGIISTGDKIKISNNNQSTTFTNVTYGDVNADGNIDIADLLKIQKHIKNVSKLSDIYYMAANTTKDNSLDIGDLLKVQKHIKNVTLITQ